MPSPPITWHPPRFSGHHILVVDKADHSRSSLAHFLEELQAHIDAQKAAAVAAAAVSSWSDPQTGVFVLHNKRRPKAADLPPEVVSNGRSVRRRLASWPEGGALISLIHGPPLYVPTPPASTLPPPPASTLPPPHVAIHPPCFSLLHTGILLLRIVTTWPSSPPLPPPPGTLPLRSVTTWPSRTLSPSWIRSSLQPMATSPITTSCWWGGTSGGPLRRGTPRTPGRPPEYARHHH